MAKPMSRKRKLYESIVDWIWPHLTGAMECPPKDQDCFSVKHSRLLDDVHSTFSSLLSQAEERDKNIESKLTAQLTLTSVLSVAVIAGLTAAMTLDAVKDDDKIFRVGSYSRSFLCCGATSPLTESHCCRPYAKIIPAPSS